jgi:hypothetical protein
VKTADKHVDSVAAPVKRLLAARFQIQGLEFFYPLGGIFSSRASTSGSQVWASNCNVFDHAPAQWADCLIGRGGAPVF